MTCLFCYISAKTAQAKGEVRGDIWAKQVIKVIWDYSIPPWKYRYGVVHGQTKEEENFPVEVDRDSMSCWLNYVADTKSHQEHFRQSLAKLSRKFFIERCKKPAQTIDDRYYTCTVCVVSDKSSMPQPLSDVEDNSTAVSSDFDPL